MASIDAKRVDDHTEANLDGNGQELIYLLGYIAHSVTDALDLDVRRTLLAMAETIEDMREMGMFTSHKEGENYGEYLHQQ
ncbi:MAG: hypothetical protein IKF90_10125 [Parasporobacterium sp.]|nr:hypothetical protein [Parasporobacterium sp.]